MRDAYIRTGQTFIIMYSIASRDSFKSVQEFIEKTLYVKDREDYVGILVGFESGLQISHLAATSMI